MILAPQDESTQATSTAARIHAAPETAGMDAATPPSAAVRGERVFDRIDAALAWLDGWVARWLPPEANPLAQTGAAANVALLIAVASGVAMLLWYSPSLQFAYPSLAAIQGRTLGGWVRALHRYSSDLTMLLLLVHAGRVFVARKFSGARWLAWVSGVAMIGLVWFIGWTGFWLVWDQPAQQVAVSSIRLLDALPVFGEPLGRLFVSDRTVPSLLFFVVFFLHMLLPLGIAVGLAIHLARISRARLLPGRTISFALLLGLGMAAAIIPAPLDAAARMAVKAEMFSVDAWYLSPLALGLRFQHAGLWIALAGTLVLAAAVPWLLGRRRAPQTFQAVVTPARCHACTQCMQDCPFDAIAMVARTDGKRFAAQAQVDPARCVGCGVCAGSCDSEGISLTWFDTRIEEARLERTLATAFAQRRGAAVALVAGEIRTPLPALAGYEVHRVPTASWVRPKLLDRLFVLGIERVLIVRDVRTEAWARDGGRWVAARLAGERKPTLRPDRSGDGRCGVVDFDPSRPESLVQAARDFRNGATRPFSTPPWTSLLAGAVLTTLIIAAAIGPSHLRIANPAASGAELILSIKAFGQRVPAGTLDAAAEAAKPVHMRGGPTANPHRADIRVVLTVDGTVQERVFRAKGVSHDGPAIAEWRQPWSPGEHQVDIEIVHAEGAATTHWTGTVHAVDRRLNVITYDSAAGFLVE